MTSIFPYGTWIDITSRGTSGDQVSDILASWKADAQKLLDDNHKLSSKIVDLEADRQRYITALLKAGIMPPLRK